MGVPGKVRGTVTPEKAAELIHNVREYCDLAGAHARACGKGKEGKEE